MKKKNWKNSLPFYYFLVIKKCSHLIMRFMIPKPLTLVELSLFIKMLARQYNKLFDLLLIHTLQPILTSTSNLAFSIWSFLIFCTCITGPVKMFVPPLLQSTEYTGRSEAPKNYWKCKIKHQVSFTELPWLFQKWLFAKSKYIYNSLQKKKYICFPATVRQLETIGTSIFLQVIRDVWEKGVSYRNKVYYLFTCFNNTQ